ncbi:DNA polymerase delta small subunit isoform X2 [Actinidia eriantha]|uniref:DNA polymerase delta small subunit isoform X2 n=1 Tax=Actinidia eriantha TaxID=165200 RepID=UPI00258FB9B5|nr:DNA polymerase delta small subunit isoform X2 [Actinidia eriantha]
MAAMEIDTESNLQRKQSVYQLMDEGFEIQKEMYRGQQYSQIYFARLHLMRTLLYSLLPNWKPQLPVCTVLGLEKGKECIIVGTLFKHMKLKPRVLDEYSKEKSAAPLVKPHNFVHQDDHLVLEDESGRVKLRGNVLLPSVYVTGIVVALHGKETDAGDFWVEDILESGLPDQIELPLKSGDDKYVVFVSGLNVGSSVSNPLQFQLLVDHITGHLGDEKDQSIAAQIVQVVIAGNSVEIPLGLLNGQPLHRCLFPGSSAYNTFKSCTNPHFFELDNVRFLGTSGQNIDDLDKYSEAKDKLEFMERTLRWRHIAPTAPNTLGCYPFTDRDPFFIERCPHVYFVGNQDKYETRLMKGSEGQVVRLICIPRFGETGIAVVLNMRNLECHALSFGTQLSS